MIRNYSDVDRAKAATRQIVRALHALLAEEIQVLDVVHRLREHATSHALKVWIDVQLGFEDALLAAVVEGAGLHLCLVAQLLKILKEVLFVAKVGALDNIFDENLFLILS